MNNIDDVRKNIDLIDDKILQLLEQRMSFVKEIGNIKQNSGSAIYAPERENAILKRLRNKNYKNLNHSAIEAIFLEIFSVSRNLEKPQLIVFLGPYGTFTHQAAESRFGAISSYIAVENIEAVFKVLTNKEAKYGVVPIENNTEGVVGTTLDCLKKYTDIKVVGEIYMDIHHSFASLCENLNDIERIYSHPQGYNQCRTFLDDHGLLNVDFIPTKSTALGVQKALQDSNSAAICSKLAAQIYNLPIMFETIEDNLANRTRFFILSDYKTPKKEFSKTSILVKTDNKVGALAELLQLFKSENINLTKLESRPMKEKNFKSLFYIDFEGHIDDENVKKVIEIAKDRLHNIVWLGSYTDHLKG